MPLVEVIVLAVGGPFVFIHCIEGTPPTKLSLPSTVTTQGTSGSSDSGSTTAVPSLAGTSHEGAGSVVGYRLEEVLVGQSTTAVGGTKRSGDRPTSRAPGDERDLHGGLGVGKE